MTRNGCFSVAPEGTAVVQEMQEAEGAVEAEGAEEAKGTEEAEGAEEAGKEMAARVPLLRFPLPPTFLGKCKLSLALAGNRLLHN